MSDKTLVLPVKRKWFDQIKAGTKREEYRLLNDYWRKRLEGREYARIVVTLGYPSRNDQERRIEFPWNGYQIKHVVSEEWNNERQTVFAIQLRMSGGVRE